MGLLNTRIYLVSAGNTITVRGSGFTSTGNTVKIGSAVVNDFSSADRKTFTLQAPAPSAGQVDYCYSDLQSVRLGC